MISTAVHLFSEFRLKPEAIAEIQGEFDSFVNHTRAEPGCTSAELFRRNDEDEIYVLMAEFHSEDALSEHLDAAWRLEVIEKLIPWLEGDLHRFTMQRVI